MFVFFYVHNLWFSHLLQLFYDVHVILLLFYRKMEHLAILLLLLRQGLAFLICICHFDFLHILYVYHFAMELCFASGNFALLIWER